MANYNITNVKGTLTQVAAALTARKAIGTIIAFDLSLVTKDFAYATIFDDGGGASTQTVSTFNDNYATVAPAIAALVIATTKTVLGQVHCLSGGDATHDAYLAGILVY